MASSLSSSIVFPSHSSLGLTQNYVSIALCNVAAASHCETQQLLPTRQDEIAVTGAPHGAPMKEGSGGAQGNDTVQGGSSQRQGGAASSIHGRPSLLKDNEPEHSPIVQSQEIGALDISKARGESSVSADNVDGPGAAGVAGGVCGDQYWLRTTNILRDIIDECLATATANVKSNLIKAMNNLMVSNERRAVLVAGHEMSSLFGLVHGYTPEVNV